MKYEVVITRKAGPVQAIPLQRYSVSTRDLTKPLRFVSATAEYSIDQDRNTKKYFPSGYYSSYSSEQTFHNLQMMVSTSYIPAAARPRINRNTKAEVFIIKYEVFTIRYCLFLCLNTSFRKTSLCFHIVFSFLTPIQQDPSAKQYFVQINKHFHINVQDNPHDITIHMCGYSSPFASQLPTDHLFMRFMRFMHSLLLTGKNEVSTLGDLHNLSLLDELTDSSTSARTVDLQTIDNGVDGDELHLHVIVFVRNKPQEPQREACRNQPARSTPCYRRYLWSFPCSISNYQYMKKRCYTFFPLADYNNVRKPFPLNTNITI